MAYAPSGELSTFKKIIAMARRSEITCFILAVMVTYLTKYAKSLAERTIYQSQPHPKHFFSPTSVVIDFPYGNLEDVGTLLEDEEVLFVMFYAPWCGKSMDVKPEFEKAARYLRHEIQFVAINCWYSNGECRGKNSFMSFPVLYFYHQGLQGYKYSGVATAEYISVFIKAMMNPVTYLSTDQQLVVFMSQNDNSVIGFFDFNSSPQPPGYLQYYYAALRLYETDPRNPIPLGVISDVDLAMAFGMRRNPTLYLCKTLNYTLQYPRTRNFTASEITSWVIANRQQAWVKWMHPSGVKSLSLSTELERGPALLSFLPSHPLATANQYFGMLREIVMLYRNCENDRKWSDMAQSSEITRFNKLEQYLGKLETCRDRTASAKEPQEVKKVVKHTILPYKKCCLSLSLEELSLPEWAMCAACIHYQPDSEAASHSCNILTLEDVLPSWGGGVLSLVPNVFHKYLLTDRICSELKPTYNPMEHVTFCCNSSGDNSANILRNYQPDYHHQERKYTYDELHHYKHTDPFVVEVLEGDAEKRECDKIEQQRTQNWLPYLKLNDLGFEATDELEKSNFSGFGCDSNKSLNFYAMSSKDGATFAEGLGVDLGGNNTYQGTVTVIIDIKNEVQYKMEEDFTKQNIAYFIQNYTSDLLGRHLRSQSDLAAGRRCDSAGTGACIATVTANTFHRVVLDPDKDVVLLYFTPYCGFCASLAHVYLSLARYFRTAAKTLVFARLDGDANDLPWQYTVEAYPTLVVFPAHRKAWSVPFPDSLPKTLPNLVLFLLKHTTHSLKLETSLNICSHTCLQSNMAATSHRFSQLNNEISFLQSRIGNVGNRIEDLSADAVETSGMFSSTEEKYHKNIGDWWTALLRRYIRLLKWRRNRKFLQKKNLRLLYSILKNSSEGGVSSGASLERRKLLRILKQYESYQDKLVQMSHRSKSHDLDRDFARELNEINSDGVDEEL